MMFYKLISFTEKRYYLISSGLPMIWLLDSIVMMAIGGQREILILSVYWLKWLLYDYYIVNLQIILNRHLPLCRVVAKKIVCWLKFHWARHEKNLLARDLKQNFNPQTLFVVLLVSDCPPKSSRSSPLSQLTNFAGSQHLAPTLAMGYLCA